MYLHARVASPRNVSYHSCTSVALEPRVQLQKKKICSARSVRNRTIGVYAVMLAHWLMEFSMTRRHRDQSATGYDFSRGAYMHVMVEDLKFGGPYAGHLCAVALQ